MNDQFKLYLDDLIDKDELNYIYHFQSGKLNYININYIVGEGPVSWSQKAVANQDLVEKFGLGSKGWKQSVHIIHSRIIVIT